MKTQYLLQRLHNFAWTKLIIFLLAVFPRCVNAQGSNSTTNDGFFQGDNSFVVYVYSDISINASLEGDAYTEEDASYNNSFYQGYWFELESILNENQFPVSDISTDDTSSPSLDLGFTADANAGYDLAAKGKVCFEDTSGPVCDDTADTDATVTAGGSPYSGGGDPNNLPYVNPSCTNFPNIDSNDPSYGSPGDSGTMTIYGKNMLNLDGSLGSISFWSDTLCVDPVGMSCTYIGGYSGEVTFNNTWGNSETISVDYYIDPSAPEDLGSVVVTTDCGVAYGPDFNIVPQ